MFSAINSIYIQSHLMTLKGHCVNSNYIFHSSPQQHWSWPDQQDEEAEAAELDLGTKIKAPKDVMLEELSLMKNKGSKMFKMRQQRVEKFIVSDENLVSMRRGMRKAEALIGNRDL